jgi:predicted RNase H-like HicB family nuclease
MKVSAHIERSNSGRYYVYIPPERNPFKHIAVFGDGMTIEEAKTDFKNVLQGFIELGREEPHDFSFEFTLDPGNL